MVLIIAAVYDNCCKSLIPDWTLWEDDNKEEFYHEVSHYHKFLILNIKYDLIIYLK